MDGTRHKYRRLRITLIAAYMGIVVVAVAMSMLYLWSEYRQIMQTAVAQTATLTRALEEHVLRTVTAIDTQLRNTGRKLVEMRALERPTSPAMVALLRQEKPEIDFVRSLYVYDASGRGHTTSLGADISKLHARDAEHFREILESGTDRLVIGRAIPGPVTRRPSIPIARGILGRDGRFAGIVGTAIEPVYFEGFYKALNLETGASLALLRDDGAVLARFPEVTGEQKDASVSATFRERVAREPSGTVEVRSVIDGKVRILSFRHVPGWKLIVNNALERDAVVAPWWRVAQAVGLIVLASLGILLALLRLGLRELGRRAEAEERFALAVQGSNDGIWDWNLVTREAYLSPRWKEILGYRDDELPNVEASFFELVHPEDRGRVQEALTRHIADGESYYVDLRMRHKDGGYRWILSRGEALRNAAGRGVRMAGSITDITELKRAETALRESDERFSKAFYGSPIATAIRRLNDDVLLDCNPAFCGMLGLRREQVVGRRVAEINFYIRPESRQVVLEKTARREPIYGLEVEVRNASGAASHLLMTVDYTTLNGEDCGLASFVDITERKRIETALQESEERFAKAFHRNPVAMAIRRLKDGVIVACNPAVEKMLGYRHGDVIGKRVEDIPTYIELNQRQQMLEKARRREPLYGQEVAIRDAWGETSHVLMTVDYITLLGEDCALASFIDITERKRVETALRESEALFATAFHNNPVAMGIRRLRDDVILDVNASFERVLGYGRDELVGKKVSELSFYAALEDRQPVLERTARREAIRGVDVELHSRTGEAVQVILTTDYVTLGGEECSLTSFLDITERKAAEERVRAALAEREVLLKEVYHRVKNNLQVVASLLGMQSRDVKDPEALRLFKESANRVKSMALVHEQLYRSRNLTGIVFRDYLSQLVEHLTDTHRPLSGTVPVRVRTDDLELGIESAIPCGLILNELISNAYKHGYDEGAKGEIVLEAGRLEDGRVRLSVVDDGRGLPAGFDPRRLTSLGMRLVITLTEQLEGTLRHSSDGGARFEIVFRPEDREAKRLVA